VRSKIGFAAERVSRIDLVKGHGPICQNDCLLNAMGHAEISEHVLYQGVSLLTPQMIWNKCGL
jgi:hypothetical protein